MGTSVEQIDKTYEHLLPDSLDRERGLLDAFDEATVREVVEPDEREHRSRTAALCT